MLNKFKLSMAGVLSSHPQWKRLCSDIEENNFPLTISDARGAWRAFILYKLAERLPGPLLLVTPDEIEAEQMASDLKIFMDDVIQFPWWGTMLYRGISPQASVFGQRAAVLANLSGQEQKGKIIVASLKAALGFIPPAEYYRKFIFKLVKGEVLDLKELEDRLINFGYTRVPRVTVPGEFAVRGEVIDIAPMGNDLAVRIVYEWNKIEELKQFDRANQISMASVDSVILHPVREVVWNKEVVDTLAKNLDSEHFSPIIDALSNGQIWRGEEVFFPLSFDSRTTIQDYLSGNSITIFLDYQRLELAEKQTIREFKKLYESALKEDILAPRPETLILPFKDFFESRERIIIFQFLKEENDKPVYSFPCEPASSFFGDLVYIKKEFTRLKESGYEVYIFTDSESQKQRIAYLLREYENISVYSKRLSSGFVIPKSNILVVQENEIFGRKNRRLKSVSQSSTRPLDSYLDLEPGDFVVHVNYGIGKFTGIKRIQTRISERDYIALEYLNEETIFIPVEQVNYIQRYIGHGGRTPTLDRVGSKSWSKKKARAQKAAEEIATRLIHLYASRQKTDGYAFPADDDFQLSFEASFPWEETADQIKAIEDVKKDMQAPYPMDRLICGDVGYGKTEVAMRAVFKAIMGGKQVVYLCPTTILTEQQYENFTERFKRFPVKLSMLSRFVQGVEAKKIIKCIGDGDVDIVIGTHRVLSQDVKFKNLGLMIIDEEQRFGVKHKEKLKELKKNIDCLILSATPIPRTLYMSLTSIRDMSFLHTAPRNRLPIETFVQEFNPEIITRSIRREVERSGQIFYLHNRIETLEATGIFIRNLIPEILVEIAHGQMNSSELEDIMHRFIRGEFQVLVATTIVENGLDIPNVNTIIIDRADMYGISQLYQIRGRVGRSDRLAYAYLLYPENCQISELAMKRLQIISDYTELGSGFKIALKDLEVRGSGNLLGTQQSGELQAVGFELYLRLIDDEIRRLKQDEYQENWETYFELDYSGFIPNSYVEAEMEKMEIYKKIAAVDSDIKLQSLEAELTDRFGPIPDELHSLLSMAHIRIICKALKVNHLKEQYGKVQIKFGKLAIISIEKVMALIKSAQGKVQLIPASPDGIELNTEGLDLKEKSAFIREKLEALV